MRRIKLALYFSGFLLLSCNQPYNKKSAITEEKAVSSADDRAQIQTLVREMLKWSDSKNSIDLLPELTDPKDSSCIGFDMDKHKRNLEKLKATNFFADEFIENYNQIILTLDKKIKNKEFEKWNTYELPTFNFANDVSPWCLCQDNLPWDDIEIKVTSLTNDRGELNWKWGNINSGIDTSWKEFSYPFRVIKERGQWKLSYLQGFDFKESTR